MGTTANNGFPYPENSALVTNGAADMKALAEAVDSALLGHGVAVKKTTATPLVSNTFADIPNWIETEDEGATFDAATGVFTASRRGLYVATFSVQYQSGTTGLRYVFLMYQPQAGGPYQEVCGSQWAAAAAPAGDSPRLTTSAIVLLNVGDKLKPQGYQSSGGNLNIDLCTFGCALLGKTT